MKDIVLASYMNHRGETSVRRFRPIRLWFGATAWHPDPQWMLEVFDLDRMETRDYAMAGFAGAWASAG